MNQEPSQAQADPAPLVSIVIPAYNAEATIGPTLQSVVEQSLTDWELVVFDDGSRDATPTVVASYAELDRRIRLVRGENGGVAAARNRGLEATDDRSPFVIFLDSDDVWFPHALSTLVGALDAHPSAVAAHAVARCIDPAGRALPDDDLEERMRNRRAYVGRRLVTLGPDEPTTYGAELVENWVVTPGTLLLRRDVLVAAGPFDPAVAPADDWDMVLRVSQRGPIHFVGDALLLWRRHPHSLSNTSPRWREAYFGVRDKTIADQAGSATQRKQARAAFVAVAWAGLRSAAGFARRGQLRASAGSAARGAYALTRYGRAELLRAASSLRR